MHDVPGTALLVVAHLGPDHRLHQAVHDCEFEVYRIRAGESVLLGTEYGGCPCGWDTRTGALETVERRAEMAAYLRWLRDTRWLA